MQDSQTDLEQALFMAARSPGIRVPFPQQALGVDEAYAIQRRLNARSALPVMVWKLGLTSQAAREAFGAKEPTIGRLPASAIYCDRSKIDFVGEEMFAEAEIVFELGCDLPVQEMPYTRTDLCYALKGIYAGIEIVRTRFATSDLALPLLIADNSMAHGLVLGRKLSAQWEDRFAAMPASLTRNDDAPVKGSTARVMDDPLEALVWLANWLRENEGYNLRCEQLIASGTCTGATAVAAEDTISVSFDGAEAALVTLGTPNLN